MPCETQRKRICFSHNSLSNIPFGRELEPVWNSKVHAAYCSLARLRYPTTPTTPGAKKLTPMPFSETSPSFNFGCIFSPIIHRKNRCVYCTDSETCVFLDSFVVQPVQCRHRIWHLFFGPKKGWPPNSRPVGRLKRGFWLAWRYFAGSKSNKPWPLGHGLDRFFHPKSWKITEVGELLRPCPASPFQPHKTFGKR